MYISLYFSEYMCTCTCMYLRVSNTGTYHQVSGDGAAPHPLPLFLAAKIFLKFTYRKKN